MKNCDRQNKSWARSFWWKTKNCQIFSGFCKNYENILQPCLLLDYCQLFSRRSQLAALTISATFFLWNFHKYIVALSHSALQMLIFKWREALGVFFDCLISRLISVITIIQLLCSVPNKQFKQLNLDFLLVFKYTDLRVHFRRLWNYMNGNIS